MNEANDTNELDNYGVWVKNTPKNIQPENPETSDDPFSLDMDLPDFDAMESPVTEESLSDPFADADSAEKTEAEPEVKPEDDFILDDSEAEIEIDDMSFDEPIFDNSTVETTPAENPVSEEIKTDSFEDSFNMESSLEPQAQETEVSADEFNLDSMEDGEIDLDSFLDSDSPSSAPAGDETEDVSASFGLDSDSDSVDLDAFLDGGDFSGGAEKSQKQEEIVEEEPMDINLSFDESANSFETEDNSDVGENQSEENSAENQTRSTGEEIDTESIDLAEFGLDEEEEENGVKGPEDAIDEPVTEVVDYEMKVSADSDDDTTVSMKDVISGTVESDQVENNPEEETDTMETMTASEENSTSSADAAISQKGQEILQQIVGELASLKDEIKNLKTDFAQIKSGANTVSIDEPQEENTGFFADGGEDDTIALSGDELDNILNNAEFLEDSSSQEENSEEISDGISEENAIEESIEDTVQEENPFETEESDFTPDAVIEDENDLQNEPVISEELPDEIEIPKIDDEVTEETSQEETTVTDSIDEMFGADTSIEDALTEDKLDYISSDPENKPVEEEFGDLDLPSPSLDESFDVDTSLDEETKTEDTVLEENAGDEIGINEDIFDTPLEESSEETISEEAVTDDIFGTEEPSVEETSAEPAFEEEPVVEEPIEPETEETQVEEPVIEETEVPEAEENTSKEIPQDLKQEIKSVLSYMDQLLENLPEDKISEFAQSEHFVTYKKLFQELGLS